MKCKKVAVFAMLASAGAQVAHADPIRLRGDALVEARAPAGLVMLQGEERSRGVEAEALVWTGAGTIADAGATADILVLSVRLREPHGFGDMRVGRFLFTTGAIRPLVLDGGWVLARAPWGSTIEVAGGVPTTPRFGAHADDAALGGRFAQSVGPATMGASYFQRRSRGDLTTEEAGLDLAAVPARSVDLAGRVSYDLASPGVAEAIASVGARLGDLRPELFVTHRSPSRLLPATSLFSVLGDVPAQMLGASARWKAAPRLDVFGTAAAKTVGGDLGATATLRAILKLDDEGRGTIGAELRRENVSTARWTGGRIVASAPVSPLGLPLRASTELELVVPDDPRGRGSVWPWALAALAWRASGWELAAAFEAASTPQHAFEANALARVSRSLEVR